MKMANSLFNDLNKNNVNPFQQFMQQMRGKNSHDVLMQVIQDKGITQQQINQLQNKVQQIMPQFDSFKNMFGF